MSAIEVIKNECAGIKKISGKHFIIAVSAAFLVTCIIVMRLPLYRKNLTMINWILVFLPLLAAMFFFYAAVKKPERSVFWFIKCLYYIGVPVFLMFLNGIFFDDTKAELYSDSFYSKFLPKWMIICWLGTLLTVVLCRLIKHTLDKGFSKGNSLAKLIYDFAVMYTPQKIISRQKREGKSKWVILSACILMVALAVFILTVTMFLFTVYSNMEFEAILFTITFAAGGLAFEDLVAGFTLVVFFSLITGFISFQLIKCVRNDKVVVKDTNSTGEYTLVMNGKKRAVNLILSAVLLLISIILFSKQTNFTHYLKMKSDESYIYDTYYVSPDKSVVTFPEQKRNLIYIFLESMECTYASTDIGGAREINYITGLTELANDKDSVNFSNTDKLGGASVFVPAISHTMGSTVAQTSGISLNTNIFPLGGTKEFPQVLRLEDVLHENGYNQAYIEGSKGEFSLYDKYVGRYEDSKVYDRITLVEEGYAKEGEDYFWKWGIEDQKLIEITKQIITQLSQEDKPFFVTMYTMDTHTFESGHRCQNCDESIANDYLASVECSSRSVIELVNWIKQQPFYENTTIILVGDHLGNEKTMKVDIDDDYVRTTYNCFINSAKKPVNSKNRIFSSLDMFPTALSAIGAEIKGDRLGLGTDLFSETKTLSEELGVEEYMKQLEQNNDYK